MTHVARVSLRPVLFGRPDHGHDSVPECLGKLRPARHNLGQISVEDLDEYAVRLAWHPYGENVEPNYISNIDLELRLSKYSKLNTRSVNFVNACCSAPNSTDLIMGSCRLRLHSLLGFKTLVS